MSLAQNHDETFAKEIDSPHSEALTTNTRPLETDKNKLGFSSSKDTESASSSSQNDQLSPNNSKADNISDFSPFGISEAQASSVSEVANTNSNTEVKTKLVRFKRKPSRYKDCLLEVPTKLTTFKKLAPYSHCCVKGLRIQLKKNKANKSGLPTGNNNSKNKPSNQKVKKSSTPSTPVFCAETEGPSVSFDEEGNFRFKVCKEHTVKTKSNGMTSFKCDVCDILFPRSFSLRRHYERIHINPRFIKNKGKKDQEIVDKLLAEENVSDHHSKSFPTSTEKRSSPDASEDSSYFLYACKLCTRQHIFFKARHELRLHHQEKHSTVMPKVFDAFKCESCDRCYSTRHELQRHKRSHSGERPYACRFCAKRFPTSTNARRHERTHTGDRPHICKVCNKGFIQKTDMVKHLRAIHKMKVTKTKAERAGKKVASLTVHRKPITTIPHQPQKDRNKFEENIDFAAYLKLDQFEKGSLMGGTTMEVVSQSNIAKKKEDICKQSTVQNASDGNLDSKPVSENNVAVGADGRPARSQKCAECSKSFTSQVNLRRHFRLKHERNQVIRSALPVSMVVDKYKIQDDAERDSVMNGNVANHSCGKEAKDIQSLAVDNPIGKSGSKAAVGSTEATTALTSKDNEPIDKNESSNATSLCVPPQSPPSKNVSIELDRQGKFENVKQTKRQWSKLGKILERLSNKNKSSDENVAQCSKTSHVKPNDQRAVSSHRRKQLVPSRPFTEDFDKNVVLSTNSKYKLLPTKSFDSQKHDTRFSSKEKNLAYPRRSSLRKSIAEAIPVNSMADVQMPSKLDPLKQIQRFCELNPIQPFSGNTQLETSPYKKSFPGKTFTPQERSGIYTIADFKSDRQIIEHKGNLHKAIYPRSPYLGNIPVSNPSGSKSFLDECWTSKMNYIENASAKSLVGQKSYVANKHLPHTSFSDRYPSKMFLPCSPSVTAENINHSPAPPTTLDVKRKGYVAYADAPLDLRHPSRKPLTDYVVTQNGVLDFSKKTRQNLVHAEKTQNCLQEDTGFHDPITTIAENVKSPSINGFTPERYNVPAPGNTDKINYGGFNSGHIGYNFPGAQPCSRPSLKFHNVEFNKGRQVLGAGTAGRPATKYNPNVQWNTNMPSHYLSRNNTAYVNDGKKINVASSYAHEHRHIGRNGNHTYGGYPRLDKPSVSHKHIQHEHGFRRHRHNYHCSHYGHARASFLPPKHFPSNYSRRKNYASSSTHLATDHTNNYLGYKPIFSQKQKKRSKECKRAARDLLSTEKSNFNGRNAGSSQIFSMTISSGQTEEDVMKRCIEKAQNELKLHSASSYSKVENNMPEKAKQECVLLEYSSVSTSSLPQLYDTDVEHSHVSVNSPLLPFTPPRYISDNKESAPDTPASLNRSKLTMTPGFDTNGDDSSHEGEAGPDTMKSDSFSKLETHSNDASDEVASNAFINCEYNEDKGCSTEHPNTLKTDSHPFTPGNGQENIEYQDTKYDAQTWSVTQAQNNHSEDKYVKELKSNEPLKLNPERPKECKVGNAVIKKDDDNESMNLHNPKLIDQRLLLLYNQQVQCNTALPETNLSTALNEPAIKETNLCKGSLPCEENMRETDRDRVASDPDPSDPDPSDPDPSDPDPSDPDPSDPDGDKEDILSSPHFNQLTVSDSKPNNSEELETPRKFVQKLKLRAVKSQEKDGAFAKQWTLVGMNQNIANNDPLSPILENSEIFSDTMLKTKLKDRSGDSEASDENEEKFEAGSKLQSLPTLSGPQVQFESLTKEKNVQEIKENADKTNDVKLSQGVDLDDIHASPKPDEKRKSKRIKTRQAANAEKEKQACKKRSFVIELSDDDICAAVNALDTNLACSLHEKSVKQETCTNSDKDLLPGEKGSKTTDLHQGSPLTQVSASTKFDLKTVDSLQLDGIDLLTIDFPEVQNTVDTFDCKSKSEHMSLMEFQNDHQKQVTLATNNGKSLIKPKDDLVETNQESYFVDIVPPMRDHTYAISERKLRKQSDNPRLKDNIDSPNLRMQTRSFVCDRTKVKASKSNINPESSHMVKPTRRTFTVKGMRRPLGLPASTKCSGFSNLPRKVETQHMLPPVPSEQKRSQSSMGKCEPPPKRRSIRQYSKNFVVTSG
ncbi:uncharacterized protein LOC143448501 isoform X3 [Clavelina lepadiformis]|uniref:uncharacterized protein LOC143448501 isoform X3 n=1 Tax=Clavelina lepadiformis TaxID=159417 RepID=UPI004042C1B2